MKLLVTGRKGQLVRSLVEQSAGAGWLQLVTAGLPEVDLSRPGALAQSIHVEKPDVVINAAAYTGVDRAEEEPDLAFRINADAAAEGAVAARDVGAPFIQLSTDYVFDGTGAGAYDESAPTNPVNIYGRSKLAGEKEVRCRTADHLILRTSWVFSPFGANFVKSIMHAAKERDSLTVVDDQRGCPTSALDLADALLLVLDRWCSGDRCGLGETFHLAGSGDTSWCGLALEVMRECRRLGLPTADVKPIGSADWPTKARRPLNSVLDSSKFERAFSYRMPDWRCSLALVVERLAAAR